MVTNDKNLIELIGKFMDHIEFESGYDHRRATYAVVRSLATRMGLIDQLKPYDEIFDENERFVTLR